MTRGQTDRRETFIFAASESGLDAAIETTFAAGVEWARAHLGFLHRSRGQLHRADLTAIATELGTTAEALWAVNRACIAERHLAAWLLRNRHHLSYPAIGRALHRDHSTAIHSVRKVEETLELLARGREILAARTDLETVLM